jgi:hypothetical protein
MRPGPNRAQALLLVFRANRGGWRRAACTEAVFAGVGLGHNPTLVQVAGNVPYEDAGAIASGALVELRWD